MSKEPPIDMSVDEIATYILNRLPEKDIQRHNLKKAEIAFKAIANAKPTDLSGIPLPEAPGHRKELEEGLPVPILDEFGSMSEEQAQSMKVLWEGRDMSDASEMKDYVGGLAAGHLVEAVKLFAKAGFYSEVETLAVMLSNLKRLGVKAYDYSRDED